MSVELPLQRSRNDYLSFMVNQFLRYKVQVQSLKRVLSSICFLSVKTEKFQDSGGGLKRVGFFTQRWPHLIISKGYKQLDFNSGTRQRPKQWDPYS